MGLQHHDPIFEWYVDPPGRLYCVGRALIRFYSLHTGFINALIYSVTRRALSPIHWSRTFLSRSRSGSTSVSSHSRKGSASLSLHRSLSGASHAQSAKDRTVWITREEVTWDYLPDKKQVVTFDSERGPDYPPGPGGEREERIVLQSPPPVARLSTLR